MATKELRETVYLESAPHVDAERGVLRRVKLIGLESRNGRSYRPAALKEAVKLYEGRKIYVDHPRQDEAGADRKMDDWAGTITAARFESDGIYGDIKLRKESGHFAGIIEAAQEFPRDVGFSHVADGESKYEGETEIVESIRQVFSVDLVTDPATTAGFFESRRPKKSPLRSTLESLPDGPQRTRLIEMVDAYLDGSAGSAAEHGNDKPADYATLCMELITQLGEALKALAMKKDTPAPAPMAPAQPSGQPGQQVGDDPAKKQEDDDKAKAFESLQRENAELKAKGLLLESGRDATAPRIKALAACSDADQKALLESWPVVQADGERPARSPALLESDANGGPVTPEIIRERFARLSSAN
jgi:hypothetical protein